MKLADNWWQRKSMAKASANFLTRSILKSSFPLLLVCAAFGQTKTAPTQISAVGATAAGQPLCTVALAGSGQLVVAICPPGASGPQYHTYVDLVPTPETDGSFLCANPLAGSTLDPSSVRWYVNGIRMTAQPSSTQGTPDYSPDPSNPLHAIPSAAAVTNGGPVWANNNTVRCDIGVTK